MPRMTADQVALHQARFAPKPPDAPSRAEQLESDLAGAIRAYCVTQWPRWKIIAARSDKPSTLEVGAHDMTVFLPGNVTAKLELKAKDGKVKPAQAAWAAELRALGHKVHVVRSMEEFHAAIAEERGTRKP